MKAIVITAAQAAAFVALTGRALAGPYTSPDCTKEPLSSNGICNTKLSPAERAAALVAAMSPQDKVANLVSNGTGVSNIGLPAYNWWNEALHGVGDAPGVSFDDVPPFDGATSFPMPLLMPATFDDELIESVGHVIGTEARAWGNNGWAGVDYWTPNVNPFKDPRWGRGSETPGEDALQVSRYARAILKGLEGDGKQRRIVATCKHYAGNDFESWGGQTRHDFNAIINEQDLAEYYVRPFQECARDSRVGSIMCAYNAVNGIPSCANAYLQETILREHWSWTGHNNYITSDCGAIQDIWQHHKFVEDNAEAPLVSFDNGCDLSCEYETTSDVSDSYDQGLLTEDLMDRSLLRLYEGLVRTGFFDGPDSEWGSLGGDDVNTAEARDLAYRSAVDGIVLLKNDKVLPLNLDHTSTVAMIGFWAEDSEKLQGGYSGNAPFLHSPAYAAKEMMDLDIHVAWGPTLQNSSSHDNWTVDALAAAEHSDYILYFGGLDTTAAGEEVDRYNLDWPSAQLELLDTLSALEKPLVVVQMGDQLDNTPLLENDGIGGILWANWPGQSGGPAVMDLIAGVKSPAGRLPVTQYPSTYAQAIPMTEMSLRPSESAPGRTYRWFDAPIAPYGFGLHYTTFEASFHGLDSAYNIQELLDGCNAKYLDTCAMPALKVHVVNKGERASDFAALVFIKSEVGPEPYPLKSLATYSRVRNITPGQAKTVALEWTLDNIARRRENGDLVLYPGEYTLLLDEPTQAEFQITLSGDEVVLDEWPQIPSSSQVKNEPRPSS